MQLNGHQPDSSWLTNGWLRKRGGQLLQAGQEHQGGAGPLGPGATMNLQVTGQGGIPATGVSAVVLNVTATEPTALSFLTAWPTGQARPQVSNLNLGRGHTAADMVAARAEGRILDSAHHRQRDRSYLPGPSHAYRMRATIGPPLRLLRPAGRRSSAELPRPRRGADGALRGGAGDAARTSAQAALSTARGRDD